MKSAFFGLGFLFIGAGLVFSPDLIVRLATGDGELSNDVYRLYANLVRWVFFWFGALTLGALFLPRSRSGLIAVLSISISLVAIETGSVFIFHSATGTWHFTYPIFYDDMFHPDPRLIIAPTSDVTVISAGVRVSHNPFGFRGDQISLEKPPGVIRIAAVGGSTTYGVHVGNGETWPDYLNDVTGPMVQVFNLGVTGYSSVEHLGQTAWILGDLDVDIAIYYVGWNDLRNVGIPELTADYSEFHAPTLYQALGFPSYVITGARYSAFLRLLDDALQKLGVLDGLRIPEAPLIDGFVDEVDQRSLEVFRRSIRSIIGVARANGIVPIFVPQVLNYARFVSDQSYGWMPKIRDRDVEKFMAIFNNALAHEASDLDAKIFGSPVNWDWQNDDFMDKGHFSPKGNKKFSELVLEELRQALPELDLAPSR